jgi:pentatricopeptide repeat protein
MKGIQISNIRRHTKHFGLSTNETHHGWPADMAAMAPGIVQLNISAWNRKLKNYVKDGQPDKVMKLFQQM